MRDAITGLDVPTVVIVGEHDPATSPDHAADLQHRIPGAALHVIPDAKHLTPLEQPDVVARLLLDVLT
jgi:pimeloyl-ACP methyl ester carboxylesterase